MDEVSARQLRERLSDVSIVEAVRIGRRIDSLRKLKDPKRRNAEIAKIAARIDRSAAVTVQRSASVPPLRYPPELPVSQLRGEIAAAISQHQVVIVAGETGSGKTTQLPKICLELGFGIRGTIGHTQPRRLAARTVAERISEELGTPLGKTIGYKVRFTETVNEATLVKLMTDGILLAEIQSDPNLRAYDVIIIDEAHERSLNIDFILGYLKRLLPRRPDLKLIITSATIETERFSEHFGDAPVISVSGRTYSVEVRYRPIGERSADKDDEQDEVGAICDAVDELQSQGDGDILVFLSGEREIRDAADALKGRVRPGTEVLPLYARLTAAEQHRVFESHSNRRVVLATNVAETSLTVPGIRYVIDPGTARISRYSNRLKVQRLPIEPISQASANQRAGRCGRVAAGICIRLYSEQDFANRPEYTEPEILRTNLASVILRMMALGLGDIEAFPFVEPPDRRHIRDGLELLRELGAVAGDELTDLGKRMAQLPVDPRLGRMLLEAERNGCLREVLIITSLLSIQDPRERPADKQQQADAAHKRFVAEGSDFLTIVNLWNYLREQQKARSSSSFRRMCRTEFLHYLRVREWQDLHGQLRSIATGLGLRLNDNPATAANVHLSLLAGLLSHIGTKTADKQDYLGARGARFAIFPGSTLFKADPQWVMAAELVDTSRLWARTVARIQPEWAESLAGELAKRTYSEPHWEAKRASTVAFERVTLYGIPIVVRRKVEYSRIDPQTSRDLFIQHALVAGEWNTHHEFLQRNRELLQQVSELQARARRTGLVADEDALFAFYDQRLPAKVVSGRTFDVWWKTKRRENPDALTFSLSTLIVGDRDTAFRGSYSVGPSEVSAGALDAATAQKLKQALSAAGGELSDADLYPDTWPTPARDFALTYSFNPGSDDDGVTVVVPLEAVPQLDSAMFEWQVPGYREQLITELIRSLPKSLRTHFIPAPDWARKLNGLVAPSDGPLLEVLSDRLRRETGVIVGTDDWDLGKLPAHLRMRFQIVGDKGEVLAVGRELPAVKAAVEKQLAGKVSAAAADIERDGIVTWDFGDLPAQIEVTSVIAYPTLVDAGTSVAIKAVARPEIQQALMWQGTRRLLALELPPPAKAVIGALTNRAKLALARGPYPSTHAALNDCTIAAIDELMRELGGPVRSESEYSALKEAIRPRLLNTFRVIVADAENVLYETSEVEAVLNGLKAAGYASGIADIRAHLADLIYPDFVSATGARRLPDVLLYVQAAKERAQRLAEDPRRDARIQAEVDDIALVCADRLATLPAAVRNSPAAKELRWMLADLRVSLFAPNIKLKRRISAQRIQRALDAL